MSLGIMGRLVSLQSSALDSCIVISVSIRNKENIQWGVSLSQWACHLTRMQIEFLVSIICIFSKLLCVKDSYIYIL